MAGYSWRIWKIVDDCNVNPPVCINLKSLIINQIKRVFGGLEGFGRFCIYIYYIYYFIYYLLINLTKRSNPPKQAKFFYKYLNRLNKKKWRIVKKSSRILHILRF